LRQHRQLLFALDQRGQRVFHVFRRTQRGKSVGSQHFRLLPLAWSIWALMRPKSNSLQRSPSTPAAWVAPPVNRLLPETEVALPIRPLTESLGKYSATAAPMRV
jgi:hypothetical protein